MRTQKQNGSKYRCWTLKTVDPCNRNWSNSERHKRQDKTVEAKIEQSESQGISNDKHEASS